MMTRRPWSLVLLFLLMIPCEAFTVSPALLSHKITTASLLSPMTLYGILDFRNDNNNDDEDDREKVLVPRGGGRRKRRYEEEEDRYDQGEYYDTTTKERPYYEDDDDDEYYDEDDDEYEDYEYDEEEEERRIGESEYDNDIIIPNPILDQVDPEGAGERFGEIARDPIFWRDVLIVVAVFNFCEYVAQVPFMEGPYY